MTKAGNTYSERKCEGRCTRCGEPADGDSLLCPPHRKDQVDRQRKSTRKQRATRRKRGLCAWCDRKPSSGSLCTLHTGQRKALRVRVDHKVVDNFDARVERVRSATSVGYDGRSRYHGKQKRGRQSISALNMSDLSAAQRQLAKTEAGLAIVYSPEHAETPRIQKREAEHAAWGEALLGVRLILDGARRSGYEVDVESLMGEDDEGE